MRIRVLMCGVVMLAALVGSSQAYGQGGKEEAATSKVPESIRPDVVAPSEPVMRNVAGIATYSERISWLREQLMSVEGFGGLWVSWSNGQPTIEIAAVPSTLGRIREVAKALDAVPWDWTRFRAVRNSYKALQSIADGMTDNRDTILGQYGVREDENRVLARILPVDEIATRKRANEKGYGSKIADGSFSVELDQYAVPTPVTGRPGAQDNSSEPAGSQTISYSCTVGFAVLNSANQPGFITAGHCQNVSGSLSGNGAVAGDNFGTSVSEALGGPYDLDRQFHLMTGGATTDNRVPGQATQQISGTVQPFVGMPISKSWRWEAGSVVSSTIQSVEGRSCFPASPGTQANNGLFYGARAAYCVSGTFSASNTRVRGGDSGGPIWLQGSSFAVGLVEACADVSAAECQLPQSVNNRTLIGIGLERQLVGSGFRLRLNAPDTPDGLYSPLSNPVRLSDSIYSGNSIVTVSAGAFVPSTATGLVLNVTVDQPAATGYLVVYPTGQPLPPTSFLNYDPANNGVASNQIVALRGQGGNVSIFVFAQARVIVDLVGYFSPTGAFRMNFQTPTRVFDSRANTILAAGETRTVLINTYAAVWANVTVTGGAATGYLTIYPEGDGTPQPGTSNVNWTPNQTVANNAILRLGPTGRLNIFNGSSQPVHVLVDVFANFPFAGGTQRLVLTTPERTFDSRLGVPVPGGSDTIISTDRARTPPGKSGIFGNITIVPQTTTSNYLTVYTYGSTLPNVSNVNSNGAIRANGFIGEITQNSCCSERLSVRNGAAGDSPTHFIVDIYGYFVTV